MDMLGTELHQLGRESSVFLFRQKAALSSASCSSSGGAGGETAKEFGNLVLFLNQLAPFYPEDLADLADHISGLLGTNVHALPSGLLEQALMLLFNGKDVHRVLPKAQGLLLFRCSWTWKIVYSTKDSLKACLLVA